MDFYSVSFFYSLMMKAMFIMVDLYYSSYLRVYIISSFIYSEASGESCLNDKKWRWLQLYAVGADFANTDLFFFLLSSLLLHLDFAAGLFLYRSPRGIAWVYQRQTEANLVLSIMCFHCCDYIFTDIYLRKFAVVFLKLWTFLPSSSLSSSSVRLSSGPQVYHSAVCILVQFLMLRLMGRTVTTVLSSFVFQMVRHGAV